MQKYGILVYTEWAQGHLVKTSLEALTAAYELSALNGKSTAAVVIGQEKDLSELSAYGVTDVIFTESASEYAESKAHILSALYDKYMPDHVLIGSSVDGKYLAASLAARKKLGCAIDVFDLKEDGGEPAWVRSVYSGSVREAVTGAAVVSVRSGSFGKPEKREPAPMNVINEAVSCPDPRLLVKDVVCRLEETVDLEDAEIIVSGGRGMGSAENFALVRELADALGGVVGASRAAIDSGWITPDHQVGQSGKIVAPKLYVACGISGAIQHAAGMMGSGYILAINKDENAPIFDIADLGIVGDVKEIIPLLIEEIRRSCS